MSEATTEAIATGESAATGDPAFDSVEQALRAEGPHAALEKLAEHLDASGDYRACSTPCCYAPDTSWVCP